MVNIVGAENTPDALEPDMELEVDFELRGDEVDHLMIYDAFAHLPIYGLEDLGFVGGARPAPSWPRATPPPADAFR